jgi:hypothetical protein
MLAGLVAKISTLPVEIISYLTFTRWGTEGFNAIQEEVVISKPNAALKIENTASNAIEELKGQFYEEYTDWFGEWAGTLKLDTLAILILMGVMTYFIFKQLKKKVEVL